MEDLKILTLEFEKPLRALVEQLSKLREMSSDCEVDVTGEIKLIEKKIVATKKKIYSNLSSWEKVLLARHPKRPYSLDYINAIFKNFQELHGDRKFRDDQAIIGGTAYFMDHPVMIVAQQKGRSTKENLKRNFGSPNPEGYRKANRLMKLAEKFNLPIVTFVDTPGAYPGIGSEERHVAEAISLNIMEMSQLAVPIITIVIGEGGSGGALGIAVADIVLILENAYYSVISPEGCAAILWKNREEAPKAAEALQLCADKLLKFGIVDEVIKEPLGGAHSDPNKAIDNLRKSLEKHFEGLIRKKKSNLVENRYQKYRKVGIFEKLTN